MTTLIVGVGHPDRGDDAAGWLVIDLLQGCPHLTLRRVTADPSALLTDPLWTEAQHVVIIDAVRTGAEPGTILRWSHDRLLSELPPSGSGTHDLGVATCLGLARALGRMPRDLALIGIEGSHYDPGSPPSHAVLTAVEWVAASLDVQFGWSGVAEQIPGQIPGHVTETARRQPETKGSR